MAATIGKDTQLSRNRPCRLFQRDESSAEDPAWSARFYRRTDPTFDGRRQILVGLSLRTRLLSRNARRRITVSSRRSAQRSAAQLRILRRLELRAPEAIPV